MSVSIVFMHTAAGCSLTDQLESGCDALIGAFLSTGCKEKSTNPSQQIFTALHFLLFPKVCCSFINCLKQISSVKLSIEPWGGAKVDVRNHLYHHLRVRNKWKTGFNTHWPLFCAERDPRRRLQSPRVIWSRDPSETTMTAHFHLSQEIFK